MALNFTLRQYQNNFVRDLSIATKQHENVVGQSPGGTGKTKTFVYIAHQLNKRDTTCLILTERENVYQQNLKEANAIGLNPDTPKYIAIKPGKTYVAMAQTLKNRQHWIDQFNSIDTKVQVIIDECHSGGYNSLLDRLTNSRRLGFTATPYYKLAKHLPTYYNECVTTEPVQWFIDETFLCDYQHIVRGNDMSGLEIKKGEYTENSQRKFFGTEPHYQVLFADIRETIFNKCMLFTASIEHCEEVYKRLTDEGFKCSISHSKREDKKYQTARFEALNETNIIVSVGNMTTGYDNPAVDLIILYRATTSLIVYLQMLFRGDRPKPGMFFTCLDYGTNGTRLLPYNYPHDWKTLWKEIPKNKKEGGVAPIILCPECDSMIFASARFCKFCDFILPLPPPPVAVGIAEDITNKLKQFKGKRIAELTAQELALYANANKKSLYCARIASSKRWFEKKAYKWAVKPLNHIPDPLRDNSFLKDFAYAMGYKTAWIWHKTDEIDNSTDPIPFSNIIL